MKPATSLCPGMIVKPLVETPACVANASGSSLTLNESVGLGIRGEVFQQLVASVGPTLVGVAAFFDELNHFWMFRLPGIIQELLVEM
jgi:hypothetical protein